MGSLIDFFLHLDKHLASFIAQYGFWTYLVLFMIIFCETGLVVTPFLPGDSLLFVAGTLAAQYPNDMNVILLALVLSVAAILGDTVNYLIGAFVGTKLLERKLPFVKQEYIDRTHEFYERHGGKTIILARFVPIVRTFAPFVAGIGKMSYGHFITYNIVGGILWVVLFTFGGYFVGNIPWVKENFELAAVLIVLISVVPIIVEMIRNRRPRPAGRQV